MFEQNMSDRQNEQQIVDNKNLIKRTTERTTVIKRMKEIRTVIKRNTKRSHKTNNSHQTNNESWNKQKERQS